MRDVLHAGDDPAVAARVHAEIQGCVQDYPVPADAVKVGSA